MSFSLNRQSSEGFFIKKFTLHFAGRGLSTLLGVALTILMIRSLDFESFAKFQICFVIGVLISWVLDFGAVGAYINFRVKLEVQNAQECLNLRILILTSATIVSAIFYFVFEEYSQYLLLVFMSFLDLYMDNFIGARQLFISKKMFVFSSVGKKAAQLILVVFCIESEKLSFELLALSLILPNVLLFLRDLQDFPVRGFKVNKSIFRLGFGNWIQSGGTLISQLDNVIAFARIDDAFLKVLASSRRISNTVGLIGSTYSPYILYSAANQNINLSRHFKRILKISALIMLFIVVPLIFTTRSLYIFVFGIELQPEDIWTVHAILFLIPFGIISGNLNAILVGNRKFFAAATATFLSSSFYLLLLFVLLGSSKNWFALGLILNHFLEICIELYFIHKFKYLNFKHIFQRDK